MTRGPGLLVDQIVFPLARSTIVIGRTDRGSNNYPDIDISPLGGGRLISRRHAEVGRRNGDFYLRDLGSRLGTIINGEPVADSEWKLDEGDAITIGSVTLLFSNDCDWPKDLVAEWEEKGVGDTTSTQLPRELPLIAQLPEALRDGQLMLHYQPQVELATGEVSSIEALIRWQHPERGMVAPERYISLAEDTGFIRVLSTFALKEAASAIEAWRKRGAGVTVGVNLSVKDLDDRAFGDRAVAAIGQTAVGPRDFTLEVTESAVMYNPGIAIAMLEHLRSLGFNIAIDDFGTGQSSLAYLKDLPANEVKLDKSFSIGMTEREEMIVNSAVQMAHGLEMTVVAEGVEDEATFRLLRNIGCEKGQGYYFGRAAPKESLDLSPRPVPTD